MKLKILEVIVLLVIVGCILFVRNPFAIHRFDFSNTVSADLEEIYNRKNPYVAIKHMTLEYSGYYTVSENDELCSYYYFGNFGDYTCFVEISADFFKDYAPEAMEKLEDISLTARMILDDPVFTQAAQAEGLPLDEWLNDYAVSPVVLSEYHCDLEIVYIYYALGALFAISIFIGIIIYATKERQVTYEE